MGNIRGKFPTQLFPPFLFRYIVENKQDTVHFLVFIYGLHRQMIQQVILAQALFLGYAGHIVSTDSLPVRFGKQRWQGKPCHSQVPAQIQDRQSALIDDQDFIGCIGQNNPFLKIFQHETDNIPLFFQCLYRMFNGLALFEYFLYKRPQFTIYRWYFALDAFRRSDMFHNEGRTAQRRQETGSQFARRQDTTEEHKQKEQAQERQQRGKMGIQGIPY